MTESRPENKIEITRFHGDGHVTKPTLDALEFSNSPDELLWIDILGAQDASDIYANLAVPPNIEALAASAQGTLQVGAEDSFAWCAVAIAHHAGGLKFEGNRLEILSGPGFVITRHDKVIPFIDALRRREAGRSRLGKLGSLSFMASLLHWVLETYFEAVMSFEAALDKTEADILEDRHDEDSVRLSTMRKTAARLRRMLSSHRIVFSSLARPDFMPDAPRAVATQFNMLENQFQNAMDAVEGTRVLVIGTLEVLTNRIALRTNKSLRVLSFAAGTFGFMSVVVGAMGMNFQTRFFQTADTGFFITVGAMLVVSSLIVFLGARRKWF